MHHQATEKELRVLWWSLSPVKKMISVCLKAHDQLSSDINYFKGVYRNTRVFRAVARTASLWTRHVGSTLVSRAPRPKDYV